MRYHILITRDYQYEVVANSEDEAVEKALLEAEKEGADMEQISVTLL